MCWPATPRAFPEVAIDAALDLDPGGFYYWRRDGEYHMWNPDTITKLQYASRTNDARAYRDFAELANGYERRLCTLRGLLDFKTLAQPIPIHEVEPAVEIVKRFRDGRNLPRLHQPRGARIAGNRDETA